jgi:DNA-nicking Smr family endonuclease
MSDQSKDDEAAFREAMAGVRKLEHDQKDPFQRRRRPVPLPRPEEQEAEVLRDLAIETPEFLEFRRGGVQTRVFADLRRGVIAPEATLDLHGMRVVEARGALARFLSQSLRAGRRCVRIVHGKGRRSDDTQPVLKQKTNQWLRQYDEVLSFCSAPRWDGGTGAAYVLLKRVRFSR